MGAPTPHPLYIAVATLGAPLGADGAYTVMLLAVYVGFAALVWLVFRLGHEAFSWPVGVAAAFVLVTSYVLVSDTASGFFDVPVVALVIGAAVFEAGSPRRGAPVLALLAVAGLQRPEVWLLSAAYWLYLAPGLSWRSRSWLALLAGAAPLVWGISDLIVTGDPTYSFGPTRQNAITLHPGKSIPVLLRDVLRLPVLAGAIAGFALALWFERARAALPAALAVLSTVAVGILQATGLALLPRWTFIPAAALAVMFGFAVMGWTLQGPGPLRTAWALAGLLGILAVLVSGRPHFQAVRSLQTQRDGPSRAERDLRSLTRGGESASLLRRCRGIGLPTGMLVPFVAYYADRKTEDVGGPGRPVSASSVYIRPVSADARELQRIGVFAKPAPKPPPGFKAVTGNRSWRLYTRSAGCSA